MFSQTIEPSKATEKSVMSLETEVFYAQDKSGGMKTKNWNLFNVLVRYGLLNNLEINTALTNAMEKYHLDGEWIYKQHQFDVLKVGVIKNILNSETAKTEIALQLDALFSLESDQNNNNNKNGFLTSINVGHALSNRWVVNYNLGYLKDFESTNNYFYKLNLNYQLTKDIVVFTENTGSFHEDFDWNQSVGLGFYPNSWSVETVIGKGFEHPDLFMGIKIIKEFEFKKKALN